MLSEFFSASKGRIGVAVIAALVSLAGSGVALYQEFFGKHSVVIASSPADAQIKLNGKNMGKAPLTLQLKRGTYTVEAVRLNYETAQHAIYVSPKTPNLVNIQLVPTPPRSGVSTTQAQVGDSAQAERLLAEVEKLKATLLANPEEALSLLLIREKLRVQEELTKALRDDLRDVKEQTKWYLGSMIAIVVGLLAVIATLFVGQRSKPNG